MPAIPRKAILDRLHAMIAEGRPIVGGGAGTGLSAKAEEAGGIDLIIIYNSGRYRKNTPVLAGVNGTDPFVLMPHLLAELKSIGFSGVQNFPTIGLFDGKMRQSFEETGMSYALEVDMIAAAHALDLLTTPYVFNPDEAVAMTRAGADIVVAHMGVTVGGTIGASSAKSLDQCVAEIDAIVAAARAVRKSIIVLCHGGPISMPPDARYILERCERIHGFYGASSMERLPAETAICDQTANFKALTLRNHA